MGSIDDIHEQAGCQQGIASVQGLPCKVVGLVDIRQILGNLQSAVQRMEMRPWLKCLDIQVPGPAVQSDLYLLPERMQVFGSHHEVLVSSDGGRRRRQICAWAGLLGCICSAA